MEKKKSSIGELMKFAGNHRFFVYASWLLSGVSAALGMLPFYFVWNLIREVLAVRPNFASAASSLKFYGWAAVVSAVAALLVYVGGLMCSHKAAFRIQSNLRSSLMRHIMTLPLGLIEKEGSGKIRRVVNDSSEATETFIAHSLPDKVVSYVTPVCLVAMMLFFDWKIGLLCLVPAILAFLAMGGMMGKKLQQDMAKYQDSLETMSNEAVEYVRGIPVVKTFGQSVFSFNRFKAAIDGYEKWTVAYTKSMMKPMVLFMLATNSVFAFLIAASYILGGKGVSDTLVLNLLFYIILTPILTTTLMKIAYSGEASMVVTDALKRMDEIFAFKPLAQTSSPKLPLDSSVEFDRVSFSYGGSEKKALDGVSLKIASGEHVAFVGPSGGGKTTLASLVARFWDVQQGSVKIGGVDVRDISSKELMNEVSYVFQDSKLLKMSILENVRLGNPTASREEVKSALEKAQCADIIAKFADGIDTVIGSKGVYLSGGEAQRISIARAFLKNSKILILDEATAFADPDNEEKVQAAFANLSKDKTVIMIAHRLSTVTNADKIFILSGGKIAEAGKHEELVSGGGIYAKMWTEYNKAAEWKV
ncbi:ABC transporter ATP-binding protein [uncultured Treponema sp.]|uniref:ABC transporter ATP-binding protein n=1 Tax=uncultured Treponema sp. TaxID=162155 RepID=UPI0025F1FE0A|nr:ABC transporter ATP-binding protein [uncultured Treponema sp.]